MSIRTKFIFALLLTSLASTAVVGGVAYYRLMRKFDDLVLQTASQNFRNDVSAYFRTYGTWEKAQRHESFRAFSERRRRESGMALPGGGPGLRTDLPPPVPLPADVRMAPLTTERPPSPPGGNLHRPPFRFYLFDGQERALSPIPPYRKGDAMRAAERTRILPIELDGKVVAYFSPQGQINYSDLDLGYLAAMRDALVYGLAAAMLLTLLLGLIFGNRLSAALRRLTDAIRAVGDGELKQHVQVATRDEVGVLANAFNRMSDEIAKSHEALRVSHEHIRQQAEQLKELSVRDALTQLHNRRYFDEQARHLFEQAVRYQHPFAVMIGDIDFFKRINDQFSHAMGDAVLRQVAEILRSKVRAADIVARYGGEEFVIAFPETDLQQAAAACESLRVQIQDYPWHELHPELKVTMSMGLDANLRAGSVETMLSAADGLLYRAKSSGRNRICTVESAITA
jgi:two-component system cell cycle response regulator